MIQTSKCALICVLMCLGSPVLGSFLHGPSAVGVPVGVPVPVPVPVPSPFPVPSPVAVPTPVAVPAPVAVPVSDTVTVPAVYNVRQPYNTYGPPDHYAPAPSPPAIFKYAASYASPQPVIKYSLGAPVTTTTTTYTGFAAPPTAQYASPPPVQFAAAAPPQFIARFAAPPTGYQFAAAPSYGRFKLHFGSPPHHSPAAVYGAPPTTQGW
ncbi:extensin [Drosophila elegans]|uniref:extensin n=1 Tax=Drosophila elegans TaxID=30023 RepID=UPI0007E7D67A|nr:extensin [Drosophila elegans]